MQTPPAGGAGLPEPQHEDGAPAAPPREANLSAIMPARLAIDVLAGVVRFPLGQLQYTMRVLPIAANRRWQAGLEASLDAALRSLERTDELSVLLQALMLAEPELLDALYAYDTAADEHGQPTRPGILPPVAELEAVATPNEVLHAVLSIWSASNPTRGGAIGALAAPPATPSAPFTEPTSTPPPSTAGRRRNSRSS